MKAYISLHTGNEPFEVELLSRIFGNIEDCYKKDEEILYKIDFTYKKDGNEMSTFEWLKTLVSKFDIPRVLMSNDEGRFEMYYYEKDYYATVLDPKLVKLD